MRVFICGVDGYLGWALAMHLTKRGHDVGGCDIYARRSWVKEMGGESATPVRSMPERLEAFKEQFGKPLYFQEGDLADYGFALKCFTEFAPDCIVHLAEMPSAPYSMIDVQHCTYTMTNNLVGTINVLYAMREACPSAHLLKLGTMGEYGTPNIDIPEGFFTIEYRGRKDTLPFPRQANSWYHQTKVHDSNNITMACRIWGLRSTDIMQGVVFGTRIDAMGDDERLVTRFDFDQCFGTAVNRFCAQAVIGEPLTPYGKGSMVRGFLPLRDSIQCLTIATENPPAAGEYRVFNQFEEIYGINDLAAKVQSAAKSLGIDATIRHMENPRTEREEHYYNPDHQHLLDLGYQPTHDVEAEMRVAIQDLMKYRDRILTHREALRPNVRWDGQRRASEYLPAGK
jgi:UDP-sulfoquinovose synthase